MNSIEAPFGYLIGMACALVAAWAMSRLRPFRLSAASPGRFETIDGLRGFLATAVMFHHVAIMRRYQLTGEWDKPDTTFYALIGPTAVILFFMITGFLFWDKAIAARGRIEPLPLYRSRIRRLVPLYALLVLIILALAGVESGWRLRTGHRALVSQLFHTLSMGVYRIDNLNGTRLGETAASPTWSLPYEWRFYAVLPLVAPLAALGFRREPCSQDSARWSLRTPLWSLLPLLALCPVDLRYLIFLFGMGAAYLIRLPRGLKLLGGFPGAASALAGLTGLWLLAREPYNNLPNYLLCAAIFLPVVCGNSLGGLLRWTAARHLGEISYSVYLLHCPLLYLLFRTFKAGPWLVSLSSLGFWLVMGLFALLTVLLGSATYHFIERPFMARTNSRHPAQRFETTEPALPTGRVASAG